MQVQRIIVPRTAPEASACVSRTMEVSLPRAPFNIEVDPHRRDTAPREAVKRLPARKVNMVTTEWCVMDNGGAL